MSTIKSQHRRAFGHLTTIPREGLPPVKIWRYSMSLKAFARQSIERGSLPALRWVANKGMLINARAHHGT